VTVRFVDDGTQRSFRLVGEDEADPAKGLVSWVAPLGKLLTGRAVGDEVQVVGRAAKIIALAA
jgi:transcription elongation GreA/GreB family factor